MPYNQSWEEKLVMELIFATPRSETEISASSIYPMYLTTQRTLKKKKKPPWKPEKQNPKPKKHYFI